MDREWILTASSFGEVIREARNRQGLTQRELAKRCDDISAEYISQIEKAQKVPLPKVCARLAEALELNREALLLLAYRSKAPREIQELLLTSHPTYEGDAQWPQFEQLYELFRILPPPKKEKVIRILKRVLEEEISEVTHRE